MSNSENIVSSKSKEWTSTTGVKRHYLNGNDAVEFLTAIREETDSPYQLPKDNKKLSVFQLNDGTWATDNADAAVLLRMKFGSDKVVRSDKDFAKIKKIEHVSQKASKKINDAKKESEIKERESFESSSKEGQLAGLNRKINELYEKEKKFKADGVDVNDAEYKKVRQEKRDLVNQRYALEDEINDD